MGATDPGVSGPAQRDGALPVLDTVSADQVRALAGAWFADHGIAAAVRPGCVQTHDGRQYGLWNLAVACSRDAARRTDWGAVVDGHFSRLLGAAAQEVTELSDAEFGSALRLRLVGDAVLRSVPDPGAFCYAPSWAPGIRAVLVLDLPGRLVALPEAQLAARGAMTELVAVGRRNTWALVDTENLIVQPVEHGGRWFRCMIGDTAFTSSLALMLPDLVARIEPGAAVDRGIIFSVPYRHQLNYRVVEGAASVLDALTLIPRFTLKGYHDSPSPLSPLTFLWLDGAVTAVSEVDDVHVTVVPGPVLETYVAVGG